MEAEQLVGFYDARSRRPDRHRSLHDRGGGTPEDALAVLRAILPTLEQTMIPRTEPKDNILNDPEPLRAMAALRERGYLQAKSRARPSIPSRSGMRSPAEFVITTKGSSKCRRLWQRVPSLENAPAHYRSAPCGGLLLSPSPQWAATQRSFVKNRGGHQRGSLHLAECVARVCSESVEVASFWWRWV